jgi:hypothetical protein
MPSPPSVSTRVAGSQRSPARPPPSQDYDTPVTKQAHQRTAIDEAHRLRRIDRALRTRAHTLDGLLQVADFGDRGRATDFIAVGRTPTDLKTTAFIGLSDACRRTKLAEHNRLARRLSGKDVELERRKNWRAPKFNRWFRNSAAHE